MFKILDSQAYFQALLACARPGAEHFLAFYDHRLGAVVKDTRLMLAPVDDHLFHRGDGVFEAMKYIDRRIYQLDEHLKRLQRSAAAVFLNLPGVSPEDLRALTLDFARAAGADSGMLRIFLGRGPGGFGVDPAESAVQSLYLVATSLVPRPESWFTEGIKACRGSFAARQEQFSHIKSTNYQAAALMTKEAHERGCDVPICLDHNGFLAESAIANICMVDAKKRLVIPEFTHALPGTTIRRAVELLKNDAQESMECIIRPIPEKELFTAAELLLLGTGPDCAAIVEYEGKKIGPAGREGRVGPTAKLLRRLIQRDIALNGVPF
ncbi:MAG: aminotransferase class IV [Deltaproteobacteria bacterium]|jgi:branched-chain amino acid aminotransferase|nr:aminotransferase class IV [Deltaproteobacteria bacterium]